MIEFGRSPELKRRSSRSKSVAVGVAAVLMLTAACTDSDTDTGSADKGGTYSAPSPDIPKKGGASSVPGECTNEEAAKPVLTYIIDRWRLDLLLGGAANKDDVAWEQMRADVHNSIVHGIQLGSVDPGAPLAVSGDVSFYDGKTEAQAREEAVTFTRALSLHLGMPMRKWGEVHPSAGKEAAIELFAIDPRDCTVPLPTIERPDLRV